MTGHHCGNSWKQGRNRGSNHRGMLVTGLLPDLPFCTTMVRFPRCDITHSWLGSLLAINNQENASTDLSTDQYSGWDSSIDLPSYQVTAVCVELTEMNQQ